MLKAFNSFQITSCFAAAPFGISWLSTADFAGSQVAFWTAIAAYVVGFGMMCACVYDNLDK